MTISLPKLTLYHPKTFNPSSTHSSISTPCRRCKTIREKKKKGLFHGRGEDHRRRRCKDHYNRNGGDGLPRLTWRTFLSLPEVPPSIVRSVTKRSPEWVMGRKEDLGIDLSSRSSGDICSMFHTVYSSKSCDVSWWTQKIKYVHF